MDKLWLLDDLGLLVDDLWLLLDNLLFFDVLRLLLVDRLLHNLGLGNVRKLLYYLWLCDNLRLRVDRLNHRLDKRRLSNNCGTSHDRDQSTITKASTSTTSVTTPSVTTAVSTAITASTPINWSCWNRCGSCALWSQGSASVYESSTFGFAFIKPRSRRVLYATSGRSYPKSIN